ncbi:MAG: DNA mismatch repair endonuclease MutL [Thiohalomonadaceae bacterium]
MPRRIHRLSPQLANQIAAGEVVERPASVVKELVENSLDAGADDILVEAEQGGAGLLRVRDNGAGIHPEDLILAVSRHATSKIDRPRDLLGIRSLGFRGEALASIASVSRFSLASRTADGDSGWRLEGDGSSPPRPCAHPVGTTVEVRDLFHNVPARRKFLRAERTEYEHLEEVVRRLALGSFHAGFTLRHNGRAVFSLRAATDAREQERRLMALLGRGFIEHALALRFEAAGLTLSGWIGRRGYARPQSDIQYVYLNGRMIRDRVVNHALRQAYEGEVEEGRHPAFVLYLEMDPTQVDVNVHPTKHEVRFRETRLVHDFLVSAVRDALRRDPAVEEVPVQPAPTPPRAPAGGQVRERGSDYRRAPAGVTEPAWRALTLVGGRFLMAEGPQGLGVADLARLVQAEASVAFAGEGPVPSSPLLFPITVRADSAVLDALDGAGELPAALGFDLNPVSDEAVLVRAVPAVLSADPQGAATALLDALARGDDRERLAAALAAAARTPTLSSEEARNRWLERARQARAPGVWRELGPERLARLMEESA